MNSSQVARQSLVRGSADINVNYHDYFFEYCYRNSVIQCLSLSTTKLSLVNFTSSKNHG
jgi:hypothetical protein